MSERGRASRLLFTRAPSERLLVALTGPPGSGKSLLASTLALRASREGLRVYVIAAPGQEKAYLWAPMLAVARSMEEIVDLAFKAYADPDSFIVVDPINMYYRGDPARLRPHLSLVLALQRLRGGVAVGVYSEASRPPTPGGQIILGYSRVFALTWRGRTGAFRLELVKPFKAIAAFRPREGGVEWL